LPWTACRVKRQSLLATDLTPESFPFFICKDQEKEKGEQSIGCAVHFYVAGSKELIERI